MSELFEVKQLKCKVCGRVFETPNTNRKVCSDSCYSTDYWLDRVKRKDCREQLVINHIVYQIGNETDTFKGYDGARWYILYNNGVLRTTTNLWHNGTLPEAMWELLPDNAKFITREEYNLLQEAQGNGSNTIR